tara:strand:- start:15 stop:254 length:240 start_codon:yes stop_codon:yes gene_type:complete
MVFTLWGSVPFIVRPGLKIGVDAAIGTGSGCSNPLSPHYATWYGMDIKLGVDKIDLSELLSGVPLELGSPVLPVRSTHH